jgi:protoporphyrinogen IX oxidase
VLVILHVLTGLIIIRLFNEGETYPAWRFVMATAITVIVVAMIVFLALAKPVIDTKFADELMRPGGLRTLVERFSPWPIP